MNRDLFWGSPREALARRYGRRKGDWTTFGIIVVASVIVGLLIVAVLVWTGPDLPGAVEAVR